LTIAFPAGPGLTQGRTDQGVDWTGAGPVDAVGAGTILNLFNSGWPGGAFIAEKLTSPPDPAHSIVYYAEDIAPSVSVGQSVAAGQPVGEATGGSSGIEVGWGSPTIGQSLQADSGAYAGSGSTPQGEDFLQFITGAPRTGTTTGWGGVPGLPDPTKLFGGVTNPSTWFSGATKDFTNWATKAMFIVLGLGLGALGVWKLANPGKSASSSVSGQVKQGAEQGAELAPLAAAG
jgi:hypothetical protein